MITEQHVSVAQQALKKITRVEQSPYGDHRLAPKYNENHPNRGVNLQVVGLGYFALLTAGDRRIIMPYNAMPGMHRVMVDTLSDASGQTFTEKKTVAEQKPADQPRTAGGMRDAQATISEDPYKKARARQVQARAHIPSSGFTFHESRPTLKGEARTQQELYEIIDAADTSGLEVTVQPGLSSESAPALANPQVTIMGDSPGKAEVFDPFYQQLSSGKLPYYREIFEGTAPSEEPLAITDDLKEKTKKTTHAMPTRQQQARFVSIPVNDEQTISAIGDAAHNNNLEAWVQPGLQGEDAPPLAGTTITVFPDKQRADLFTNFPDHPQIGKASFADFYGDLASGKSAAYRDLFDQLEQSTQTPELVEAPVIHPLPEISIQGTNGHSNNNGSNGHRAERRGGIFDTVKQRLVPVFKTAQTVFQSMGK